MTYVVPPTFIYHIVDGNFPSIYITFWIIASISALTTILITLPTIYRLLKKALQIRDANNYILIPNSYRIALVIVGFPPFAVMNNLVILMVPIVAPALNFVVSLYGAFTMFLFVGIIIQYLGIKNKSTDNANSWQQNVPPSKFYASPPCCCLYPCAPNRTITTQDFRRLYPFIFQFMIIFPAAVLFQQFPGIAGNLSANLICIGVQAVSVNGCIYGTNVILKASGNQLKEYGIECIYQYVQLGFNLWWLPAFIIQFINIPDYGEHYPKPVMVVAYGAVVQCIIWVLLSIVYRYYFGLTLAEQARTNAAHNSYTQLDAGLIEPDVSINKDTTKQFEKDDSEYMI